MEKLNVSYPHHYLQTMLIMLFQHLHNEHEKSSTSSSYPHRKRDFDFDEKCIYGMREPSSQHSLLLGAISGLFSIITSSSDAPHILRDIIDNTPGKIAPLQLRIREERNMRRKSKWSYISLLLTALLEWSDSGVEPSTPDADDGFIECSRPFWCDNPGRIAWHKKSVMTSNSVIILMMINKKRSKWYGPSYLRRLIRFTAMFGPICGGQADVHLLFDIWCSFMMF